MVAPNVNELTRIDMLDGEMAELSLLVPGWQAQALERLARAEGMTVGQYLRRVLNKTLAPFNVNQPGYYLG
jgi:hypothetical protein